MDVVGAAFGAERGLGVREAVRLGAGPSVGGRRLFAVEELVDGAGEDDEGVAIVDFKAFEGRGGGGIS